MAFDYGSIDLGLRNPFKKEGVVTAIRGTIQTLVGLYLLVQAAGSVKEDAAQGWILVVFGLFLLGGGVKALGGGIFATLRYFVGRNHPTSLAQNFSKSETSTAQEEKRYTAYNAKSLEEMLVGRKNSTFVEPKGFLARLLHSLFPKLLFMPYPVRNMAQRIFGAWVKTLTAVVAYGFVAFVTLAGFAGDAGELVFPVYSALLLFYLVFVWSATGKRLSRAPELAVESLGGADFVKVVAVSIVLPVVIGLGLSWFLNQSNTQSTVIADALAAVPSLHPTAYLIGIFVVASLVSVLVGLLLRLRIAHAKPVAEVSELRENWQESVHPNEIFINLDNLVMANRRYKEVPNRVYRELDPQLQEQVQGKGSFRGEMIQEIQPKVRELDLGPVFHKGRLASLVAGNALHIVAVLLTLFLAYSVVNIFQFVAAQPEAWKVESLGSRETIEFLGLVMSAIHLLLLGFLCKSFANILANAAHLFYAEIQFESLLVYFKCEGTFTESKISTGTGIHDSTRSENTLVRSSITPWVVVSRIITTTFASTGMRNLEHPRHILEMYKSDEELQAIRNDVIAFLKDRESIASITSQRDLGNASQIYQLNQQTRAIPETQRIEQDEAAAGYLRQESEQRIDGPKADPVA